jgi:Tol biopolymer transport system component
VTDQKLIPSSVDLGGLSIGMPFWSPGGTRFAFTASTAEAGVIDPTVSIYVVPSEGGEPLQVTQPAHVNGITWSPDGTTLGYTTVDLSGENPTRAFVVSANGGELRAMLDGAAALSPPLWSPAGDAIAIVTPDGLALTAADGSAASILVPTEGEQFIGEVLWSPSGDWLLYSLSTGREPSLWIVPSDGSGPPGQISPDGAGGQQADWQPVLVPLP